MKKHQKTRKGPHWHHTLPQNNRRPQAAPLPPYPPHRLSMRAPPSPLTQPSVPRNHSPRAPSLLQVANMLDPLKFDGKKNRDLAPPPRAKFLHFRPTREPTLQERMDEVVYPMAEAVKPALNPNLARFSSRDAPAKESAAEKQRSFCAHAADFQYPAPR